MGMSTIRLVETMTTIRTLADECVSTLKVTQQRWADTHDALDMCDRIKKINDLIKTMNYDWDYVPGEWDFDKKQAQK